MFEATENDIRGDQKFLFEKIVKLLKFYTSGQTRYTTIPKESLSTETVGGIFVRASGKRGFSIIRFDRGHAVKPQLYVDPKGFSSPNNPHIPVPVAVVSTVGYLNAILQYTGMVTTLAVVFFDGKRLWSSFQADIQNSKKNYEELQKEAEREKEMLRRGKGMEERKLILNDYEQKLREIRLTTEYQIYCETIKTGSTIAGEWIFGITGASAGAWAGGKLGSLAGCAFGVPGTTVGGFLGEVFGALSFGFYGYKKGEELGESVAVWALKELHNGKYKNETLESKIKQNIRYYYDLLF